MRRPAGQHLSQLSIRKRTGREVLRRLRRAIDWCRRTSGDPGCARELPLAERILRSRGALEGERKQVTVLFADIKGSMELIQGTDPEDARRILDPTIEAMMGAVHRYEGTVNKVLGDGIMALFGAPIAHEDHAVRACYAALAMRSALREISEKTRRDFGVEVQVRTGLHSGEVVVRTIGNDLTGLRRHRPDHPSRVAYGAARAARQHPHAIH